MHTWTISCCSCGRPFLYRHDDRNPPRPWRVIDRLCRDCLPLWVIRHWDRLAREWPEAQSLNATGNPNAISASGDVS